MAPVWWKRLVGGTNGGKRRARPGTAGRRSSARPLCLEHLEDRALLSTSPLAATRTGWAITPSPTVYGQAASFTAQVTSRAGRPTGEVEFKDGSTVLGESPLDGLGRATFSIASLGVGNHSIVAEYLSSGRFAASTSVAEPLPVSPAHDAVLLQSSPPAFAPLSSGQQIALTASVTGLTVGAGNPGGRVQFLDNGRALGQAVALDGLGKATLTTSFTGPSSHTITADYLGDGHFQAGVSAPLSLSISGAHKSPSATIMTLPSAAPLFGQSLSVTVQVIGTTPGAPRPTGQVQITVDGNNVGGPTPLDATGKVSMALRGLFVGSHILTATYLGDGHFSSSSQTSTVQVNSSSRSSTVTKLTASTSSPALGKPVVFTAQVTSAAANLTGLVQFKVDGKAQGQPVALDLTGKATLTLAFSQSGNHTVTADYLGDGRHNGSLSATLTLQVGAAQKAPTTTKLTASASNPSVGQKVTYTAQVAAGSGKPTGKVQFFVDGKAWGQPVTIDAAGKAAVTIAFSLIGKHTVSVAFLGDSHFGTSASPTLTVQVGAVLKAPSVTKLTASAASPRVGQKVTYTAQVKASTGAAKPTGKVQFYVDGKAWGSAISLDAAGRATLSITFGAAGKHTIAVKYLGDTHFATSASPALTVQVSALKATTTKLTASPLVSVFHRGVTLTAQVTAGADKPTGKVQFFLDNGKALGQPVALDGAGTATLPVTWLAPGTYHVTAKYLGSGSFATSTSAGVTITINKAPVGIQVKSSAATAALGQKITFTARVTGSVAGAAKPTGQVQFLDNGVALGKPVTLNAGGEAILSASFTKPGSHSIRAKYLGDADFAVGTSAAFVEQVKGSSLTGK